MADSSSSSLKRKSIDSKDKKPFTKKFDPKSPNSSNGTFKKPYNKAFNAGKSKFQSNNNKSGDSNGKSTNQPLTKHNRKQLRRDRKKAKPNAELIESANELYKYKLSHMPKAERTAKINSIINSLPSGKLMELALKHSSSRVFQLCIKYGTTAIRESILEQLKGKMIELSSDHYASHLILKLLQYYPKPSRAMVFNEFKGNFVKLSLNAYSAKVLDYLFAAANNTKIQHQILMEFYSPEFALVEYNNNNESKEQNAIGSNTNNNSGISIPAIGASLSTILSNPAYSSKSSLFITNLYNYLTKCFSKSLFVFRFVQALAYNYFLNCNSNQRLEFLENMQSQYANLITSPSGCRLLIECITNGAAKDRKHIVKALKPLIQQLLAEQDGHLVLLRAIHAVDDTVLLQKQLLQHLVESPSAIIDSIQSVNASKVYLLILAPESNAYISSFERKLLLQEKTMPIAKANNENEETTAEDQRVSKKSPQIKHFELLSHCLLPILQAITQDFDTINQLAKNQNSANVLLETFVETAKILNNPDISNASLKSQLPQLQIHFNQGLQLLVQTIQPKKYLNQNKAKVVKTEEETKENKVKTEEGDDEEEEASDIDEDEEEKTAEPAEISGVISKPVITKEIDSVELETCLLVSHTGHYCMKRLLLTLPELNSIQLIQLLHNEITSSTDSECNYEYLASHSRSAFVLTSLIELLNKFSTSFDPKQREEILKSIENKKIINKLESIVTNSENSEKKGDKQDKKQNKNKKAKTKESNGSTDNKSNFVSIEGCKVLLKLIQNQKNNSSSKTETIGTNKKNSKASVKATPTPSKAAKAKTPAKSKK